MANTEFQQPVTGNNGLNTQLPGQATTVSAVAGASGGIASGNLIQPDVEQQLVSFESDDTPLTQIMLKAKRVKVGSPVVKHYVIDAPRSFVTTTTALAANTNKTTFALPLGSNDSPLLQKDMTLSVCGVRGYEADGTTLSRGNLMLIVVGINDEDTPIVKALNGPKNDANEPNCTVPAIPANTKVILMSNALSETQMVVPSTTIIPTPKQVFLQKRGMNHVVSKYFDSQTKEIPYDQAVIMEASIRAFKLACNRSLYRSVGSQTTVKSNEMGNEYLYTMTGICEQIVRSWEHRGRWTYEALIGLTKVLYTGDNIPKNLILLAGKNFMEGIQCIDFSNHPEVTFTISTNSFGWSVRKIHTIFGDLEFKHDPTMDRIGFENSAFAIDTTQVVHYVREAEKSISEKIQDREATRKGLIVWDGIGLKGTSHMFINGEEAGTVSTEITFHPWSSDAAPTTVHANCIYYLLQDCTAINENAVVGTMWQKKDGVWTQYTGTATV